MKIRLNTLFGFCVSILLGLCGVFIYQLHAEQVRLKKMLPFLCSEAVCKQPKEVKQVIETVVRKTNPWGALQPKIKDTVVQIMAQVTQFNWLQPYQTPEQGGSAGSGFFIKYKDEKSGKEEILILTNAHVINGAKLITILIPSCGKQQFDVEVVGVCFDRDVALLRLKNDDLALVKQYLGGELPYLSLGSSDDVHRAEEVMTMGYPLGQQGLKSTVGVVSGRENLQGTRFIQIDAPINPGNSGGPSLNFNGEVIGINSRAVSQAQNIGYIIPIKEIKLVLDDLYHAKDKLVRRYALGILYNAATHELISYLKNPHPGGVYVADVYEGSIMHKAGVRQGDMIYEFDGHAVDAYGYITLPQDEDKISLSEYVAYIPLGQEVMVKVYRNGEQKLYSFTFGDEELPAIRVIHPDYEEVDYEIFGGFVVMELRMNHLQIIGNAVDELIKYRHPSHSYDKLLLVTHILPASQAQRSQIFSAGNILSTVNGIEVKTLPDLRKALSQSLSTGYLTVGVSNGVFGTFSFDKVLSDEVQLSSIYHYPISSTMQNLYQQFMMQKQRNQIQSVVNGTTV